MSMETLGFSVRIGQESVIKLTEFLVFQGIPFMLQPTTSTPSLTQHTPTPVKMVFREQGVAKDQKQEPEEIPVIYPAAKPNDLRICKELIQKYLHSDFSQPIPTEVEIAKEQGISVMKLKLVFKRLYGKTLYQMYMDKRMDKASSLLKSGYKAVEVARLVGYGVNSSIKFNKMFQKYFGTTPKKYQVSFRDSVNTSSAFYT